MLPINTGCSPDSAKILQLFDIKSKLGLFSHAFGMFTGEFLASDIKIFGCLLKICGFLLTAESLTELLRRSLVKPISTRL